MHAFFLRVLTFFQVPPMNKTLRVLYVPVEISVEIDSFINILRCQFLAGSSLALVTTAQFLRTIQVCHFACPFF